MKIEEKREKGRPKKTVKDTLQEGWEGIVLSLYEEGASDVEIKAKLGGICNSTWDRWMKEEDHFAETIKRGRSLSKAWWEANGRVNLQNKEFNHILWYMNMKNRHNWRDKQETEISGDGLNIIIQNYGDEQK